MKIISLAVVMKIEVNKIMIFKIQFFLEFLMVLTVLVVFTFLILPLILRAFSKVWPESMRFQFRFPKYKNMTMAQEMNAKGSKAREKILKKNVKRIKGQIRACTKRGEYMLSLDYDFGYKYYFYDKETFLRIGKYFEEEGFYVQYNKDEYQYPSKIWISWRDGNLK